MSAAGVAAEWITEEQGLAALLPEWEALWRAHLRATPFQSPAWQYNYWRCFRSGRLAVLALRIGSTLAAVLPFCAGEDALWLMAAAVTDIQDVLLDDRLQQAIVGVLQRSLPHGVSLVLEDVPDHSALLTLPAPPGWHDQREPYASWPTLTVPAPGTALSDVLPAAAVRNLRHAEHRAERRGGMSIEPALAETLDRALDLLFALHRSWATPSPARSARARTPSTFSVAARPTNTDGARSTQSRGGASSRRVDGDFPQRYRKSSAILHRAAIVRSKMVAYAGWAC